MKYTEKPISLSKLANELFDEEHIRGEQIACLKYLMGVNLSLHLALNREVKSEAEYDKVAARIEQAHNSCACLAEHLFGDDAMEICREIALEINPLFADAGVAIGVATAEGKPLDTGLTGACKADLEAKLGVPSTPGLSREQIEELFDVEFAADFGNDDEEGN